MARPSYGSSAKKRAKELFTALVDYANDELECESEEAIERLRHEIQVYWQDRQRLVVRTKVRFLESLLVLKDVCLSGEQIKESIKRLADFLEILEDNRPNRSGSEVWHFTLKLWYPRSDRLANLRRFDEEWERRRLLKSQQVAPETEICTDYWRECCKESLETQQYQRLTTNPLTVSDGVRFALDEIYVPLGLVERQQQERKDAEVSAASGSRLYEPEESEFSQIIEIEEFLASLTEPPNPKRIAIVGEPGAGKTTLLQKVANWLLEHQQLPIWISLADLQGSTLEDYLLQDWLKQATCQYQITPELQSGLAAEFPKGRVWLLLDAVDEMATDASTALAALARQLRGWVGNAQIVLTCRLNVWDSGNNALETFTTYRNQSFSYGDGIDRDYVANFIDRWFPNNLQLSQSLRVELNKPERRRIKDMVKNPLRLALLCRSWGLTQGNLPNTKATLYQQFVETIYQWKQDRFPTTLSQRYQLNQVLGDLALSALSRGEVRFRLSHSFVVQEFGEARMELLTLALQLGWLNQVGISATTGERIYAFYHPTFQEYFAAQSVTDWRFFFPYLFTPGWREVIWLWFGKSEIEPEDKERFINYLIDFEDGCGGFYSYRTYFLAATGLAEFPQSRQAENILNKLIYWRFGAATRENSRRTFPSCLSDAARVALLQSDRTLVIKALTQFLQSSLNPFASWNAAYSLGKTFDPGNPHAIATLTQLLDEIQNSTLRLQIADSLSKIDPGNEKAIATLTQILLSNLTESMRRKAAYSLGKADLGNFLAITTLEEIAASTADSTLKLHAAKNLLSLQPENTVAIAILQSTQKSLTKISHRRTKSPRIPNLETEKLVLEKRLTIAKDVSNQRRLAYRLGTLEPGHEQAVQTLIQLLLSQLTSVSYKLIVENLQEIILEEQLPQIIALLKPQAASIAYTFDLTDNYSLQDCHCYKLLWFCAQKLSYQTFSQAWNN
ncbi:NACHT domain-containing protein [Merismopedia glauca]|uniref:AAA family ATPase n=1 Tax=Merismopedia glauca CCAP 1448/3 TaxID=1296344 RepID=A0A2T1C2D0_9CYAN|nr:HEAT repeat domain-containing protein [Merismopedia glauca]PSB02435.1 AAA family ATPase [Merismopedia glauca CCAP 1448/3]